MGRLDGKVVFITGAARGQGRSHAVAFAREGAQVVAVDLCEQVEGVPYAMSTPADLDETVRLVEELDQRCVAIKADARSTEQMQAAATEAVQELGHIDTALINHGVAVPASWDQASDEIWDMHVEANLVGAWHATQAVIPHLIDNQGGSIIFTSSAAALAPFSNHVAYVAVKHGVIGMMRALAAELGPHWIRVNAVCPGSTATPMLHNQGIYDMFAGPGATQEDMVFASETMNMLPLPWGPPEAISQAMVYLASDDARWVTGVALPVDCGMSNQPPGMGPVAGQRIAELEHKVAELEAAAR